MRRCPLTYELSKERYSPKGIHLLSSRLKTLHDFPYTAKEQVEIAIRLASKLSIQGVQPKLSAILSLKKGEFEAVENGGKFIIKPPHQIYSELPENEDLTMRLAKEAGIEVPQHGLIYNKDESLSYFIKRFDRAGRHKLAVEDFGQLLELDRETKYAASIENIISVIVKRCTFPKIEFLKLFRLILFNFLVGNEDMHIKNLSLITRDGKIELSPAYDLLNSTIVMNVKEEMALTLNGKKSNFKASDFLVYLARQRLELEDSTIEKCLDHYKGVLPKWREWIQHSFLSEEKKRKYLEVVESRWTRLVGT